MKKIRVKVVVDKNVKITGGFQRANRWRESFKGQHPVRYKVFRFLLLFFLLTVFLRLFVAGPLVTKVWTEGMVPKALSNNSASGDLNYIENEVLAREENDVKGVEQSRVDEKIGSDVGFIDRRVLALEDFFNAYGSPLASYSDEFIKACEKYDVKNWQLIPAIAIAETNGCQTDISYEQRNCWGWGGARRVNFHSFEQAIDTITKTMKATYGNRYLNPKDIQHGYCGRWCYESKGWKWAMGVNSYIYRINDFGEKYGLERTHEIRVF